MLSLFVEKRGAIKEFGMKAELQAGSISNQQSNVT
jgi:hypothetical protein